MDVVGVMATYFPVVLVCSAQSREAVPLDCAVPPQDHHFSAKKRYLCGLTVLVMIFNIVMK